MPRILIVDDYADNLELMCRIVGAAGHEVLRATTGAAALELATSAHPELVLLDLELPDATGYDVLARLRDHGVNVPIVAITGSSRRAEDDVFDGHVLKPFTPRVLLAAVASYLPCEETV